MEIIILLIRAILRAMNPPEPRRQAPPDEIELIRRRIELARRQQEQGILVAQMPPQQRQQFQRQQTQQQILQQQLLQQQLLQQQPAQQPTRQTSGRLSLPPNKFVRKPTQQVNRRAFQPAGRKPARPQRAGNAVVQAAPPPIPQAPVPARPLFQNFIADKLAQQKMAKPSRRALTAATLRTAIITSEILKPPLSLRDDI